ncbi:MFS transporter [Sphaerisporangium melleum]|uniref:MFS transporter n=1 Tax=Sphaerisporangium melleum TaxID=321316 RepID=A0A917QW12_9ACTN|nr:MFS transporter [Sphaerisporangium melleum]GGK71063.1 MFS transporter [Sphaerisporangium melleum]GII70226.1 MFS transporter [Sphaerisporangium melleum]
MTPVLRVARSRAILTFVLAGLMCGTFTVRIPALAEKLGISEASVGVALLAWGLGALVTMQSMRGVMARVGSRAVLRVGAPLSAATLAGVAFAPSLPWLVAATALFGMAFGAVDVAMNAQGSTVEQAYGRPLMNGMHAGWCVGAGSAGLLGTLAIFLEVPFTANLVAVAVVSAPVAYLLSRGFLPDGTPAVDLPAGQADVAVGTVVRPASRKTGSRRNSANSGNPLGSASAGSTASTSSANSAASRRGSTRARMPRLVYLLGAIAFGAFMVEGAVADWNGLFLRNVIGAPEAVAALGYPIFEAGMLIARLIGDRLRASLGTRRLIAASGLGTAVAFTVVITTSSPVVAVAGMALVGLTVAAISPIALSLAGTATPTPGPAIAQTGAMGYAGLLLGPVVIGFVSHATTLRLALGIAIVLGVLIAVAARFLPRTQPRLDATTLQPTPLRTPAPEPLELVA